ncbi:MAG: hypothetical protein RI556_11205 [Hydrogenovibrio sp.]|uniref:hypothetical protein n=1 Tax=Hydrogenovibrio sp. TaxID=2065821 RepID=UPI00286FC31E|nr:hypothetical protein [Hydrogenovibrio sp.]MDR9499733.1 hypothetical protein [Hydrogenovibrio sp.]
MGGETSPKKWQFILFAIKAELMNNEASANNKKRWGYTMTQDEILQLLKNGADPFYLQKGAGRKAVEIIDKFRERVGDGWYGKQGDDLYWSVRNLRDESEKYSPVWENCVLMLMTIKHHEDGEDGGGYTLLSSQDTYPAVDE